MRIRVKFNTNKTAKTGTQPEVHFVAGRTYEVPEHLAWAYLQNGWVDFVAPPEAVAAAEKWKSEQKQPAEEIVDVTDKPAAE
jgi:hypothetical protein